ncbi:Zinc finger MYM-type protein 4 [Merluccius polli]|uniref:Zinc finger MYM-type protein 4 n=1 Tax=Merluccius polli TaxID=89951 RepID=A0AA47NQA2_MERPO|nr:Zinc finger MYM-type protein 4 [Merluccius polli]
MLVMCPRVCYAWSREGVAFLQCEVPDAPGQDSRGQEEGQVIRHAMAAVDRRQEAAIEAGADKTTTFPDLAEANRSEGMSGGMDEVLEGVPAYPAVEEEEEDEDWQFTLPKGTLEDDDDDDDMDRTQPTEESQRSGIDQEFEKVVQLEKASGPANHSSPVSSDGATVEQSKEPEANQVEKIVYTQRDWDVSSDVKEEVELISKEPAEAPPQGTASDAPILSIKDEPVDEGYDAALLPQSSISKIKEELEHKEEELRISSVFSFRGGNAFAPQGGPVPYSQPTTIFIPNRATLLQASAMAPLAVKPRLPAPAPPSAPTLLPLPQSLPQSLPQPQPHPQPHPQPATISTIRCSGCSKILVKGQTAFQRKGATQLFCSTVCLSSHLPPTSKARSCYHCNKEIDDPKSMVMVPLDNNTFMHFCSPLCLSLSSTDRKKTVAQLLYSPRLMPRIASEKERLQCIVCKSTSKIEHEVTHQGHVHSLCSNACFLAWRKSRQLAMNCCEGCGLYCKSDSDVCQTLTVEKAQLHFCSPTCVSTYKQSCMRNTECTVCHKSIPVSNAIMESDPMGKVQLYCSPACVGQSGPAKHMLTGTAFPCSQCNLNKVPQYHLATADGKIRNFCSYECVSVFRIKKGESISQPNPVNGTTSSPSYSSSQPSLTDGPLPGPVRGAESPAPAHGRALPLVASPSPHHSVTAVPPLEPPYSDLASQAPLAPPSSPGHALTQTTPPHRQLTCHQCSKLFDTKPLLFSYQGHISMFCNAACCEQYKAQKNIMAQCESCKLENVVFEVLTYNEQDRIFCSQSCKQQFQDEVTAGSNGSWRPCSYCYCVSHKRLHSHYNGRVEEFCRAHCMSQYTVLYYGMARCDSCRTQGYMAEQLRCTSSVRNFCTRACLAQYCYQHFEAGAQHTANHATRTLPPPHAPSQAHHPSKMNPVIGDVVSLASDSAARPHGSEALAGSLPTSNTHDKTLHHASTQTDAMRLPVARRCQVKNKSVLCRPFTLNQETMCQLLEPPVNTSGNALPGPLPARLSGRHFLDMRQGGSVDCVVCGQHKRKRVNGGQEEGHPVGKRGRMEESGKVRVEETGKVGEPKLVVEKFEEEKQLKEECTESKMKEEERGETSRPAQEIRCCSERRVKVKEEEVKIEMGVGVARRLTAYHCKTCPEQPALCPAPCFELYHTRLLYRHTPAELGTAGQHHTPCDELITAHASVPLPPPATCDPTQTNTVKANSGPQ